MLKKSATLFAAAAIVACLSASRAWAHGDQKQGGVFSEMSVFHIEATVRNPDTEVRAYVRGRKSHVGIPMIVQANGDTYFELDDETAQFLGVKAPDLRRNEKKYYLVQAFLKVSPKGKEQKMTPETSGKYPYFSFPTAYGGAAYKGEIILRFKKGSLKFPF